MLIELSVRDLGVIEEMDIVLGEGMTAITGETGAGKTLVVGALGLLVGARAEPSLVRAGADEALVEGRFELDGEELVLSRVIPLDGRSRAFVNGRMVPASTLGDLGARLVDLHGQHAHQSLLTTAAQRRALDRFADIDVDGLEEARARLRSLASELEQLGGDERARAREIELLSFQVAEITGARIDDVDEGGALSAEEDRLADAAAHRQAAAEALVALNGDDGALDSSGAAIAALASRPPFEDVEKRLRGVVAELGDVAGDLRHLSESLQNDPGRLEEVRVRRKLLGELRRKYGETLGDVLAFAEDAAERLRLLESVEARAGALQAEIDDARARVQREEGAVRRARQAAAPRMSAAIEAHLRELAMPDARVEIRVPHEGAGERVEVLVSANPGTPVLPLPKVASGGELSRIMLATRLVTSVGPPTLVFDEVDAGVGGAAALAVGRALAGVAAGAQVLVVTHLAQVAAFADRQIGVIKEVAGDATVARAQLLGDTERQAELGRMLSGQPDSDTARHHAEELLDKASQLRRAVSGPPRTRSAEPSVPA